MFQPIRALVHREPAATLSALSVVAGAVCALVGQPEYSPVLVAVAAAFLGLRTQVVPAAKATETAVQAARDAAMTTAANLTEASVGYHGEITDTATGIINDAVTLVSGLLSKR